jgi:hypothetical protein
MTQPFPRRSSKMSIAIAAGVIGATLAAGASAAPFTVVALPDTQYYTQTTSRNDTYFKGQTNWIVQHKTSSNIAFVMGLGDIQNDGNPYYASATDPLQPDLTRPTGYVADEHEWSNASTSLHILDTGGVPYSVVAGNHDYLHNDKKQEPIYYLKWFGPQRFAGKSYFGGASPDTPTSHAGMNSFYTFQGDGRTYLNIGLQYAPDTYDLAWAQSVINDHPGIPTIITTHAMLDTNGYQSARKNIWTNLVKNDPQVIMTINGHITGAYRQSENNIAGQPVHEMLVDYQFRDFPGYYRGAGYMRLMQFDPGNNVVHVKSYSPVTGQYLDEPENQFDLAIDFNGRFGPAGLAQNPSRVQATRTFRQGSNGYTGTVDTQIDDNAPTTSGTSSTGVWSDGDAGSASGNQPRQGLIRFDNLFGGSGIPKDATIQSATLTLHTSTATNAQSNSPMELYRMLSSWNDQSTWNSLSGGISTDGTEAVLAADGIVNPTAQGTDVSFDVTESLYAWLAGAPNQGWAVLPGGNDGWLWNTSEADLLDRPELSVTYLTVPEPSSLMLLLLPLGLVYRRRRETCAMQLGHGL